MTHPWRFDGFLGGVLWVDLTAGTCEARDSPHEWCLQHMGGKRWRPNSPSVDDGLRRRPSNQHPITGRMDTASHPTMPLLFMTGPYQGSKVGSSGRAGGAVHLDRVLDTYIGGNIGHDLQAGWDGLSSRVQ